MSRASLAVATISILALLAIGAVPAQATGGTQVTGGGSGLLPPFFGSYAGDRLSVELSARITPEGTAAGIVHLVHRSADGGLVAELTGTVSCLAFDGSRAWASGTLTAGRTTEAPGFDPAGQTFAVSVVDGGPQADLAGVDLSFFGEPHAVPDCEPVPPYLTIDRGNLTVSP